MCGPLGLVCAGSQPLKRHTKAGKKPLPPVQAAKNLNQQHRLNTQLHHHWTTSPNPFSHAPVIRAEVPVLPESIQADSTVLLDTRVGIPAEQEGMAGGTKAGGESKVWKVGDWRTEARRSNQKEEARQLNHKVAGRSN
ncbi:hypothetical protein B0H14DRAFT_2597704 [Mycena olivaceomarginata]|nr:hypothetical protein B0H14DRAFT_2597704 [Mycena olivaceomarginata]